MLAYLRWGVCIGLLVLVACEDDNKLEPGEPKPCEADGQCTEAGKAVCDLSVPDAAVCVQCTPEKAGACTGITPVCGADSKACRGCSAHAECTASAVCEAAGSCADAGKVLYAATNGTGMACSKDTPCSLNAALGKVTATQNIVKLAAGTYMTNIDVDGNMRSQDTFTIAVVAEPGTVLQGPGTNTPVVRLRNGAKAELSGLRLTGTAREGVKVESASTVKLTKVEVTGAQTGVGIPDGLASIEQSVITMSTGVGVDVGANGELVLSRSMISFNAGGIRIADDRKATITNSFIVKNTGFGGVSALLLSAASKIDFNTIVDNVGGTSSSSAGGVICDRSTLNLTGNIVFRNNGGSDTLAQEFGDCTYNGSLVLAGNVPVEQRPKFVAELDWHLAADAPATVRNVAGVTCSGVDYDGDTRPQGGACELGADEIKQ